MPSAFASPRATFAPEVPLPAALASVAGDDADFDIDQAVSTHLDFDAVGDKKPDADDLDLTGQLLRSVTGFGDAETDTTRADDGLGRSKFKPDFDPFEDDIEATVHPTAQTSVDPFADAADDDESDPFADVALSRKTAPQPNTSRSFDADPFAPDEARPADADIFDDEPLKSFGERNFDEDAPADDNVSVSTRDALAAARAAVRASLEGAEDRRPGLGGLKLGLSRTRATGTASAEVAVKGNKPAQKSGLGETLKKAFKASSVAVALTAVGAGGYVVLKEETGSTPPVKRGGATQPPATPIAAAAVTSPVQDREALNPQFLEALQALTANDPVAVDKLKAVANQGYAPAQFRLGRIYEGVENSGALPADKAQARLWTQRAAEGGLPIAMHNLGMMLYAGDGGQQDRGQAAVWFRRAAERGFVESQYNLGILYREGLGVTLNPTEAYKWLLVASAGGDKEAAQVATELKAELSAPQRRVAETEASDFKPVKSDYASVAINTETAQP
ncbi:MAG: hypothetical protein B7Z26_05105 [Asticcacaulis sp. 32-58-5]|nr:MAG: hypothetical protein B7Z26_05105 [Asticcacaulis sp. 32-58-5]